ncbi:MAG: PD-(D/E)XK nuclease family protein [Elusimicrobiota bacterium]|nr:PD-(D/E)XK nuclease family protein [Elusimicrobiota bacterium]
MKTDIVFIDEKGVQSRRTFRCGKTSFLLSKFGELVSSAADVSRILVLCPLSVKSRFADAAAEHCGNSGELHIDSFSGFAKWALKKNSYRFTESCDFTIISGKEEEVVLKDILFRPEAGKSLKTFSSCRRFSGFISEAVNFIDRHKINPSGRLSADEFYILSEYEKKLRERDLFDLRDVENCCLKSADEGFFKESFDYIFLDGWEDINSRESEIFIRLVENAPDLKGIYIAGDSSRGIYDFLGGDAEGTGKILEKKFGDHRKSPGFETKPNLDVLKFLSVYDEAEWILSEIKKHLAAGVSARDMAVISRGTGDEIKMLEDMAAAEGVPVSCPSGAPFFKHPQFLAFLSFLYFVADMDEKVSFPDMLALPVFGMTDSDIFRFGEGSLSRRKELSAKVENVRSSAKNVIRKDPAERPVQIKRLYEFCGSEDLSGDDIVLNRLFGKFFEYAGKFHNITGGMAFDVFISFLSDSLSTFARAPYLGEIPGTVKLLTVHEAKGDHFKFVFIPGAVWGQFPRKFLPGVYIKKGEVEERHYGTEKKIFLSALASGTDKVCVTFSVEDENNAPSPYIDEFLGDVPVRVLSPAPPFSVKMKMTAADKVSGRKVKTDIFQGSAGGVSVSSLESYISCPLNFFIERIIRLEKRISEPALCGKLVHTILERFHGEFPEPADKGKMLSRMAELTDAVFSSGDAEDFETLHSAKCWKNFFGSFLEKYVSGQDVFDVAEREKKISVTVKGVDVTGRIDRVDRSGGGYEIIDYKTSPGAKFKKKALLNKIGRGEHLALPVYAAAVDGSCEITLLWLADYEKPGDYPLKVTLQLNDEKTAAAIEDMKEKLHDAAENMKKGNFPPALKCPRRACPYGDLCRRMKGGDVYER